MATTNERRMKTARKLVDICADGRTGDGNAWTRAIEAVADTSQSTGAVTVEIERITTDLLTREARVDFGECVGLIASEDLNKAVQADPRFAAIIRDVIARDLESNGLVLTAAGYDNAPDIEPAHAAVTASSRT